MQLLLEGTSEFRSQELQNKNTALRGEVSREVRSAKVDQYASICEDLKQKTRQVWQNLNLALGRRVR